MYSHREMPQDYWTERCLAREDMKGKRVDRGTVGQELKGGE